MTLRRWRSPPNDRLAGGGLRRQLSPAGGLKRPDQPVHFPNVRRDSVNEANNLPFAQCDDVSYQDILDADTHPAPDCLRERATPDLGTAPISVDRYTDPSYFDRSIESMWLKTWQMACREEEIPRVGDFIPYEIVGKSLIIVRTEADEFKALHNSCLHRGRKLVTEAGHSASFRCPFHGFTWRRDGSFLRNPVEWDFPQCSADNFSLPEARVGRCGGFIFINFDPDAPPLEEVLDPIPRHFERWDYENKYIAAHVGKVADANWNVNVEAFMESHHSVATHPQLLKFVADANSQYDIFSPYVTRHVDARGIQSPLIPRKFSQDEIAAAMFAPGSRIRDALGDNQDVRVPEGMTARSYAASLLRKVLQEETGYNFDHAADCEMGDAILYSLFPNAMFFGGFSANLVYRWRPVGKHYNKSMMEIYILKTVPKGKERPKAAQFRLLGEDEPWGAADELGSIGPVLDQDQSNMEPVQLGLEASATGFLNVGHYLEIAIRRHQKTLDQFMRGERPH